MTSGFANVNSARLYYETAGEGHPLVFLHAGVADRRMWNGQWDVFARQYKVIRYDMRGFGQSSTVDGGTTNVSDLHALLNELGVERAHLVGLSLGGEVIIDYSLLHPERVSTLVIASATPSGFEFQGAPPPEFEQLGAAFQAGDLERAADVMNKLFVDGPFREYKEADVDVHTLFRDMNMIALRNGMGMVNNAEPLDPPAAQRLNDISTPALVIAGKLDNPEIVRSAEVMASGMPNARKLVIDGAAHMVNMEQPDAFNKAVLEFLAGVK